jgi:hypothetical protein
MHNRLRLTAIAATTLLMTGAVASTTASAAPDRAPSTSSVVNARISGHCSFDRIVVDVKGNAAGDSEAGERTALHMPIRRLSLRAERHSANGTG